MGTLRCLFLLAVQCWAHAAPLRAGAQGLACVNDFVNNVSCTWDGAPHRLAPGVDCWIFGVKKIWIIQKKRAELIIRSCKLRRHTSSVPGCSFTFEKKEFNPLEVMPNISLECNGTLVENLTHYKPVDHIRMNPPGLPSINKTADFTWIWWSPSSPLSRYIESFDFQVQVTEKNQTWKDAHLSFEQKQVMKRPSSQVKGICQVRVRVRPSNPPHSHWSYWSPTASWMGATDALVLQDHGWFWMKTGLMLGVILVVMTLVLYGSCMINGWCLKGKLVPTPSNYFHTLHSVHKGNLKKWLNPLSASESFVSTQSPDHISPVEVCESWDVDPCTSPCSSSSSYTSALLPFQGCPPSDLDTGSMADSFSSSSSSYFYNMSYFMSASSSGSTRSDSGPAYFAYRDDFHSRDFRVSLCPSFTSPPAYEALKRESQSPDSGLGIEQEDKKDRKDESEVDLDGRDVSDDPQKSFASNSSLDLPPQTCPPHPPGLNQKSSASQQVDVPVAGVARPTAGAMCRSSSVPVEPCKTGYLTLKELQTTFSNKSI